MNTATLKKLPKQRSRAGTIVTALVAVLVLAASAYYQPWRNMASLKSASTEKTLESRAPILVTVTQPVSMSNANVVLPATFRPWQTTTLHARVSGYLKAWHRDLGAAVKAGELLAEIETPELDQELAESEALAKEAAAAAAQAAAERVEAQAELEVAEAQLVRVKAEHELARTQMIRREKLLQDRAISQEEYDTVQRQLEARVADVAAGHSDVVRRRRNLDTRAAVIAVREATAKSRDANVLRLKELQQFKRIVAPFDGVVTNRSAEVGMLVTAGKESLFVVEDISRIRVQVQVPQTYASQTHPGSVAVVSIPESDTKPAEAKVTRVAQSVDPSSRTMLAEIELANDERQYQPGSYAQVRLTTSQTIGAWTIPTNTLAMRTDGAHVALVGQGNQVEIRRVVLGRDLGNRVIVAEGIHGEEQLVVNPGDELVSGARVEIKARSAPVHAMAQQEFDVGWVSRPDPS